VGLHNYKKRPKPTNERMNHQNPLKNLYSVLRLSNRCLTILTHPILQLYHFKSISITHHQSDRNGFKIDEYFSSPQTTAARVSVCWIPVLAGQCVSGDNALFCRILSIIRACYIFVVNANGSIHKPRCDANNNIWQKVVPEISL
jgi:hypothetical protein